MSGIDIMRLLTASALDHSRAMAQMRFQLVAKQLQAQYNRKVAEGQNNADSTTADVIQSQVKLLRQQKATFNTLATQYGTNANILADLKNQITALDTAAGSGDAAGFDQALSAANTDIGILTVVAPNATFQSDGIERLKTDGLGVQSSATYDLSTAAGQAAAQADVQSAEARINQIFQMTTTNQSIAGSKVTALDGQINDRTGRLQQAQLDQLTKSVTETQKLKQQLQTQIHLLELSFANGQRVSDSLMAATAPPPEVDSIFSLLV